MTVDIRLVSHCSECGLKAETNRYYCTKCAFAILKRLDEPCPLCSQPLGAAQGGVHQACANEEQARADMTAEVTF